MLDWINSWVGEGELIGSAHKQVSELVTKIQQIF